MKLKANIVAARNAAGIRSNQGAPSKMAVPYEIKSPQLVPGSWTPSPRKLKKLSTRITVGMSKVENTITGPMTLGSTCHDTIRKKHP